jgi:hypothetical protein
LESSTDQLSLTDNKCQLNLCIEVHRKGETVLRNVPFTLKCAPELVVECDDSEVVLFDDGKPHTQVMPVPPFTSFVSSHPFFAYNDFHDYSFAVNFLDLPFKLTFAANGVEYLQLDFTFADGLPLAVRTELIPWQFPQPEGSSNDSLLFNTHRLTAQLPFQLFFLQLSDLLDVASFYVIEQLDQEDLLRFIRLHSPTCLLLVKGKREVAPDTMLRNLLEFDDALKDHSTFEIVRNGIEVKQSF